MLFKRNKRVDFDIHTICAGHHNVNYRGIKAIRSPFDYVLYQMILFEQKPDLVIEIGTNHGGGALYLADLMNLIGHGEIHTIDIEDRCHEMVRTHPRISTFLGGWQGYNTSLAEKYTNVLIIEDGAHTYEDTLAILRKFAYLVKKDSYFIIEDGIVNELGIEKEYNGGPLRAIDEFLSENNSFGIDRNWCDFFGKNATFNVDGYLKRIK